MLPPDLEAKLTTTHGLPDLILRRRQGVAEVARALGLRAAAALRFLAWGSAPGWPGRRLAFKSTAESWLQGVQP